MTRCALLTCIMVLSVVALLACSSTRSNQDISPLSRRQPAGIPLPSAVPIFSVAEDATKTLVFVNLDADATYDVLYSASDSTGMEVDADLYLDAGTARHTRSSNRGSAEALVDPAQGSDGIHLSVTVRIQNGTGTESPAQVVCVREAGWVGPLVPDRRASERDVEAIDAPETIEAPTAAVASAVPIFSIHRPTVISAGDFSDLVVDLSNESFPGQVFVIDYIATDALGNVVDIETVMSVCPRKHVTPEPVSQFEVPLRAKQTLAQNYRVQTRVSAERGEPRASTLEIRR